MGTSENPCTSMSDQFLLLRKHFTFDMKLKAQASLSDRLLSVCILFTFSFPELLCHFQPNMAQSIPWLNGIQIYLNEGQRQGEFIAK